MRVFIYNNNNNNIYTRNNFWNYGDFKNNLNKYYKYFIYIYTLHGKFLTE
jgi:hypothetical protein